MSDTPRWLYLVVCAAPPVLGIDQAITLLGADGRRVCLIATPTAATWIDLDDLAARTGCLTRSTALPPGQQEPLPRADAVLAAPLTFNSINKWAGGISDCLALGVLNELLSTDVPIIAAPCVKPSLRSHPAHRPSTEVLTTAGVTFLDPDAITTRADNGLAAFRWAEITAAVHRSLLRNTKPFHCNAAGRSTGRMLPTPGHRYRRDHLEFQGSYFDAPSNMHGGPGSRMNSRGVIFARRSRTGGVVPEY